MHKIHSKKCIKGGNHAQFENYGKQTGDGEATITAEEQLTQTVDTFLTEVSKNKSR